MSVLYLVPTRGRPKNAVRLTRMFHDLRGSTDTELLLLIDDDDPELEHYERCLSRLPDNGIEFCGWRVGPRERLNATLNRYAKMFVDAYDIIGFMGDDHIPRTKDWDITLTRTLRERGVGIAYGNDIIQGKNLPTAVVMTSNIIKRLGYMSPPELVHMYLDNFWRDLGQATGVLSYVPEVIIEHVHPVHGHVDWDDTYVEAGQQMSTDQLAYISYQETRFSLDVEKIFALIREVDTHGVPQVPTG